MSQNAYRVGVRERDLTVVRELRRLLQTQRNELRGVGQKGNTRLTSSQVTAAELRATMNERKRHLLNIAWDEEPGSCAQTGRTSTP